MNLKKIIGRIFSHNCNNCGMCVNSSSKIKIINHEDKHKKNSDELEK